MRPHLFLIIAICMVLSACSNDSDKKSESTGEHVWKAQTDALKQAQEVGALANDVVERQRKAMEKLNNE